MLGCLIPLSLRWKLYWASWKKSSVSHTNTLWLPWTISSCLSWWTKLEAMKARGQYRKHVLLFPHSDILFIWPYLTIMPDDVLSLPSCRDTLRKHLSKAQEGTNESVKDLCFACSNLLESGDSVEDIKAILARIQSHIMNDFNSALLMRKL